MPLGCGFQPQRKKVRLRIVQLARPLLELLEVDDPHPLNLVQCCQCKDVHWVSKRRNKNGTDSDCPKCGHDVYTYP